MKMYTKTKELGSVGGGRAPEIFVCRSANVCVYFFLFEFGARIRSSVSYNYCIGGAP